VPLPVELLEKSFFSKEEKIMQESAMDFFANQLKI
jgi:hypothetical protein